MTYLVTGATGKAGRHVVDSLVRAGRSVRALTRRPETAKLPAGVEVVGGDLTRPETLEPALDGIVGMHLITVGGDDYATLETGPEIVKLATSAGVRRVTVLWNGQHGPVEQAIEDSDLEWTHLRPVDFMSNALGWAASVRTDGLVREPFATTRSAVVDEADVGAVAAAVLSQETHAGKAYTLTGPEALTVPQRVDTIATATGQTIRYVELSEHQARQRWREAGHAEELIDLLAAWQGSPPAHAYTVTSTVEDLLGRPPRSFADWAREHATAFG